VVISGPSTDWTRDRELTGALERLQVPYVSVAHGAAGFLSGDELAGAQRWLGGAAAAASSRVLLIG